MEGDLLDDLEATRSRLEQLAFGYSLSNVLFTAAELGVYDHLVAGPCDVRTLSLRIGASLTGTARLCTALTALGLLRRDANGCFSATPTILRLLRSGGEDSLVPSLRYHQRHLAPLLGRLSHAVRDGAPQHSAWSFASPNAAEHHCYVELARHPSEYELFLDVMERASVGVGSDISRDVDLGSVGTLIDLGGGGGCVARELLAAWPRLDVEMVDVPVACRRAALRAEEAGLGRRFRATAGDFTRPLEGTGRARADAVLLSAVLADWGPAERGQILANAASLLRPGGLLLVSETLLDDDRTGPLLPALFSLVMLVAMPGDSFTLPELRSLLESSGFDVRDHRSHADVGRRDLIVAELRGTALAPVAPSSNR